MILIEERRRNKQVKKLLKSNKKKKKKLKLARLNLTSVTQMMISVKVFLTQSIIKRLWTTKMKLMKA